MRRWALRSGSCSSQSRIRPGPLAVRITAIDGELIPGCCCAFTVITCCSLCLCWTCRCCYLFKSAYIIVPESWCCAYLTHACTAVQLTQASALNWIAGLPEGSSEIATFSAMYRRIAHMVHSHHGLLLSGGFRDVEGSIHDAITSLQYTVSGPLACRRESHVTPYASAAD